MTEICIEMKLHFFFTEEAKKGEIARATAMSPVLSHPSSLHFPLPPFLGVWIRSQGQRGAVLSALQGLLGMHGACMRMARVAA